LAGVLLVLTLPGRDTRRRRGDEVAGLALPLVGRRALPGSSNASGQLLLSLVAPQTTSHRRVRQQVHLFFLHCHQPTVQKTYNKIKIIIRSSLLSSLSSLSSLFHHYIIIFYIIIIFFLCFAIDTQSQMKPAGFQPEALAGGQRCLPKCFK
jgi:hypothetical protein